MKLTFEQIKEVTTGAADVVCNDGIYSFYRFNSDEMAFLSHPFRFATAGVQMKFRTDGKVLKLKVRARKALETRSYFAFDVFVNSVLAGAIQNFNDEECVGDYANKEYPLGTFDGEIDLGEGEKNVRIVFPHSLVAEVEEVVIEDATYVAPAGYDKTMIFYGDSITQGFDSLHPSKTYASKLAEALGMNPSNRSIGGAGFSSGFGQIPRNEKADCLVVAYGTNDWGGYDLDTLKNNTKGFLQGIKTNYPGVPVYVITPLWRSDWEMTKKGGTFWENFDVIKSTFEKEENMTVIPGFDLIPHDTNLFGDLWLHPNEKGFEYFADNLMKYFVK